MKRSFIGLDCLRFAMAFYIAIFHTIGQYPTVTSAPVAFVFAFGGFATSTFFVLSGFLLSHVYIGANPHRSLKGGAKAFLVKRFANIYPIHLISLALTIALGLLSAQSVLSVEPNTVRYDFSLFHVMRPGEAALNIGLQLLLLQAWNPLYLTFNGPNWSLSVLAFFYVVFPAVAPRLLRLRGKMTALMIVWMAALLLPVMADYRGWYGNVVEGALHTNPLVRLPEFIAGILAYGIYMSPGGSLAGAVLPARRYLLAAALCSFVGGAYLFAHGPVYWQYPLHNGVLLPTQIVLVLACATYTQESSRPAVRLSSRLGTAALSLFALHKLIFSIFVRAEKIADAPFTLMSCLRHVRMCIETGHSLPIRFGYYPLYLAIAVIVALAFQDKVVTPIRRRIQNKLLGNAAIRDGMAATAGHLVMRKSPESAGADGIKGRNWP